ncbi:UNVERIFIED_CONTAM: hypothetical protein HDU68_009730 [Siphonaria sp. JEL0065]|nr:hypothetical protein HDU68_009730 [Siphonaria sp. JEL0065]
MTPVSRGNTPEPSPVLRPAQLADVPAVPFPAKQQPAKLPANEYEITSLPPSAVDDFLDHLDSVFNVTKPNGSQGASRALFQDHWEFDPERDPHGVFVAVANSDQKIVSSVRVYNRQIHVNQQPPAAHPTGGIGDVATNLQHRGKSLAKKLMNMADEYMHETRGYKLGVLHAAPLAAPIYASIGWKNVDLQNITIDTTLADVRKGHAVDSGNVKTIVFEKGGKELEVVRALHSLVAPSILGSFARTSDDYWVDYIGKNNDPRRIVSRLLFTPDSKGADALKVGDCVGYAICEVLRFDLGLLTSVLASGQEEVASISIQIKEVFCGKVATVDENGFVTAVSAQTPSELSNTLSHLLSTTLQQLLDSLPNNGESLKVKLNSPAALLPGEVLEAMSRGSAFDAAWWTKHEISNEVGWMFKVFEPFTVVRADGSILQVFNEDDIEIVLGPVGEGGLPFAGCKGVTLKQGSSVFGFLKTDAF